VKKISNFAAAAAASQTAEAAMATVNPSGALTDANLQRLASRPVSIADFKAAIWRCRVAAVRRDDSRKGRCRPVD